MKRTRVLILGAAGRDFHNFNVVFRNNPAYEVVGFTATQIPNIAGRRYPAELAGEHYPEGIPIYDESDLTRLVQEMHVDQVIFAYSDLSHQDVMHLASTALAAGADFKLLGPNATMLKSKLPVIAVCAVRTGAGKSQTSRRVVEVLREAGKRIVALRHPMPYGDLVRQRVQRFATYDDLDRHECTIEEREEYEPYLDMGAVVYAGVDYAAILAEAEQEADVILWDGGNNDFSFIAADLYLTVADPHRPGHESDYHPGEANMRLADAIIINKVDSAAPESIAAVRDACARLNPQAAIIEANSPVTVADPEAVRGKRVLVVEDGPTLTHGEMAYGAGTIAAERLEAGELVDPRPYAIGTIREAFANHPHIGTVLPALGYGQAQMRELEQTIDATPCDLVISATPIDLTRIIKPQRPLLRATYDLEEVSGPRLADLIQERILRG